MQLPALSIRGPDLGQALMRAAQIKGMGLQNRLLETKMKRSADLTDALSDYARPQSPQSPEPAAPLPGGISPEYDYGPQGTAQGAPQAAQVNRQSGASGDPTKNPAWAKIMAADPDLAGKIFDIYAKGNAEHRKQIEEAAKRTASLLVPIQALPPEHRALAYAQTYGREVQKGSPMQGVSPVYDPLEVQQRIAFAMGVKEYGAREADTVKVISAKGQHRWVPKYQLPNLPAGTKPYEKPKLAKDVGGYQRYVGGEQHGKRVFPDAKKAPGTGALTASQIAGNREIDNARSNLAAALGITPGPAMAQELQRRMTTADPLTGLPNVDYNSHVAKLAWQAAQSKTGDDPDQAMWQRQITGLFPPGYKGSDGGKSKVADMPRTSGGRVAKSKLVKGRSYRVKDPATGNPVTVKWNGRDFEEVE